VSPAALGLLSLSDQARFKMLSAADADGLSPGVKFTAHAGGVNSCFHLTNSSSTQAPPLLSSSGKDHTVRLWQLYPSSTSDTPAGAVQVSPVNIAVAQGHKDAVQAVAGSPSGQLCCSAGWDGQLLLWDTGAEAVAAAAEAAAAAVAKLGQQSRKKRKTGGQEGLSAAAAEPLQLQAVRSLEGHMHCVAAVTWPEEGVVFSGGWDHSVRR
jgi:ribosome biogenesis protein YTM1